MDGRIIPPKFNDIQEGFEVILYKKKIINDDKITDKVTDNLTNNQIKIIKIILTDNQISTSKLSSNVGISQRKIKENISKLKSKGILKRIGSAKGGYWEIIDNE